MTKEDPHFAEPFPEDWLTAYLDGELDDHQRQMVESAMAVDSRVALIFADLKTSRTHVQSLSQASKSAIAVTPTVSKFPSRLLQRNTTEPSKTWLRDLEDGLGIDGISRPEHLFPALGASSNTRRRFALAASLIGLAFIGTAVWLTGAWWRDYQLSQAVPMPGAAESRDESLGSAPSAAASGEFGAIRDFSLQRDAFQESAFREGSKAGSSMNEIETLSAVGDSELATTASTDFNLLGSADSPEVVKLPEMAKSYGGRDSSEIASRQVELGRSSIPGTPNAPGRFGAPVVPGDSGQTGEAPASSTFAVESGSLSLGGQPAARAKQRAMVDVPALDQAFSDQRTKVSVHRSDSWSEADQAAQIQNHPHLQSFHETLSRLKLMNPGDQELPEAAAASVVYLEVPLEIAGKLDATVDDWQLIPALPGHEESIRILFASRGRLSEILQVLDEGWSEQAVWLYQPDGTAQSDQIILLLHLTAGN